MNNYKAHQELIQEFKYLCCKEIQGLFIFDRHVGLFYTKNGNPIRISIPGMADAYGLYKMENYMIHMEFEFKTGSATQSKDQKNWQKFIESNNGLYLLVKNAQIAASEIKEYLQNKKGTS